MEMYNTLPNIYYQGDKQILEVVIMLYRVPNVTEQKPVFPKQ